MSLINAWPITCLFYHRSIWKVPASVTDICICWSCVSVKRKQLKFHISSSVRMQTSQFSSLTEAVLIWCVHWYIIRPWEFQTVLNLACHPGLHTGPLNLAAECWFFHSGRRNDVSSVFSLVELFCGECFWWVYGFKFSLKTKLTPDLLLTYCDSTSSSCNTLHYPSIKWIKIGLL